MKRYNDIVIVGIDHGYGNIKTANTVMPTGIMKLDTVFAVGQKTESQRSEQDRFSHKSGKKQQCQDLFR